VVSLFVSAFGVGLAFCAPPGVITAEALRRGLSHGFWSALLLELGSLIGDAAWAALALAGAALLVEQPALRVLLSLIGVGFLLRLAWGALRAARSGAAPAASDRPLGGDFASGALLSLTNPLAVAFWLGVGGTMVTFGVADPGRAHFAVFFAGFMLAATLWCFAAAAAIAWGRRWLTPTLFRAVNLLCALALGYFGLRLLWGIVRPLFA
jgi:chemosensory pili system protein ChpE